MVLLPPPDDQVPNKIEVFWDHCVKPFEIAQVTGAPEDPRVYATRVAGRGAVTASTFAAGTPIGILIVDALGGVEK